MKKKMLSMALALIMCLSLMPSAFAAETVSASDKFTDVPANAWYLNELNYAVANGYISGTSATTFSPDATITRGQFVTILGRMLGVSTASGKTKFTDVKADSWYAPYVAWAAEKGYVNGTSSTTFAPDANITVEQMATILANYISKSGTMLKCYTQSDVYKDASSVSGWAVANVEVMRQYGLLHIDANGNVNPRKDASRAEGAYTLVKFAKAAGLGEEPTIISKPSTETPAVDYESLVDCRNERNVVALNAAVKVHDDLWASGKLTSSMTQKQKARVYYDWVLQNCSYDWGGVQSDPFQDISEAIESGTFSEGMFFDRYPLTPAYTVFVGGKATCGGYTDAYNLLLKLEGIECDLMLVSPPSTDAHMWSTAILDGVLCHIDTTWGDTTDQPDKYFCMTDATAWGRFGFANEAAYRQYLDQLAAESEEAARQYLEQLLGN